MGGSNPTVLGAGLTFFPRSIFLSSKPTIFSLFFGSIASTIMSFPLGFVTRRASVMAFLAFSFERWWCSPTENTTSNLFDSNSNFVASFTIKLPLYLLLAYSIYSVL